MFTGNKDIDLLIINKLSDTDLTALSQVSKKAYKLCKDEFLWMNRTLGRFPKRQYKDIIYTIRERQTNWKTTYSLIKPYEKIKKAVDEMYDDIEINYFEMSNEMINHLENKAEEIEEDYVDMLKFLYYNNSFFVTDRKTFLDKENEYLRAFKVLGYALSRYYGYEKALTGWNNHKTCDMAKMIMQKEGRPFKCPDGLPVCYSCYYQSITGEILINLFKNRYSSEISNKNRYSSEISNKNLDFVDFLIDASKTYYIVPNYENNNYIERPLLEFINKHLLFNE